jgi:hypothetical protein
MGGNASKMGGFPMGGSSRPTGRGGRSRTSTREVTEERRKPMPSTLPFSTNSKVTKEVR